MGGEKCNVAIWMMYNLRVKVNVEDAETLPALLECVHSVCECAL
jgi:hypothetical protein